MCIGFFCLFWGLCSKVNTSKAKAKQCEDWKICYFNNSLGFYLLEVKSLPRVLEHGRVEAVQISLCQAP